ncbi:MAG TPA: ADP-ribosyltransferase, partial [Streptosporangiaceae bacterium]|nr:ADP-ribosyltransferase [Streptosporangiaceae bacterium]
MSRIQSGYATNRNSSLAYLTRHAALNGAMVQPVPGSLDVAAIRKRLEIVGPIGFKSAIARGADTEEATRAMATQMAGVADEAVRNGDRDVITQSARFGRGVVGWRRRLSGKSCGFCAMLASRGAVYVNRKAATVAKDGMAYHPHCHCWAEPLYTRQQEPPQVRQLQRQWQRVTAGHSGKDAQRVWRQHWEQRATPEGRARNGIAASRPSGGTGVPMPAQLVDVRPELTAARSTAAVGRAFSEEFERITGRRPQFVEFTGSAATAREHAEGLLRGLERFPDANLDRIVSSRLPQVAGEAEEYAHATGSRIAFNHTWTSVESRQRYLDSLAADTAKWEQGRIGWHPRGTASPTAQAVHEFGHVLDLGTLAGRAESRVLSAVRGRAAKLGLADDELIAREISAYATSDARELVAEAFADVVMNGERASVLSREIYDIVEAEYRKGGFTLGEAIAAPARAAKAMTAAEFEAALRAAATGDEALQVASVSLRTAAERKAYADYVSQYRYVNGELRENAGVIPLGRATAADRRLAAGLDSAMERSGLPEDIFVHRVGGTVEFEGGIPTVGAEWTDHGYVSTSTRVKAPHRGEVQMRILAPRGTRAVATSELDVNEVLLDRGSRFRVVKVDGPDAMGVWHADVELVGQRAATKAVAKKAAAPVVRDTRTLTQLKAAAKTHGIPVPVGAGKPELAALLDESQPLATRIARGRQAVIDQHRSIADSLTEVSELLANGASERALGARAQALVAKHNLDAAMEKLAQPLVKAMQSGDAAAIRREMAALQRKVGLKPVGAAPGDVVGFDRKLYQSIGGDIPAGAQVRVLRPGFEATVNGERVVLSRPAVQALSKDEIRAIERKTAGSVRFEARVRSARKGTAATAQTEYRFTGNAQANADMFPDPRERREVMDAFAGYR